MIQALVHIPSSLFLISKFVRTVFPLVNQELDYWQQYASANACPELAHQALTSIHHKKFHCQGGSIYCLYNGVTTDEFVKLIVALQTISDYLDNLCDRAGIADEAAFRQLHLAMTDALDPDAELKPYYQYYPHQADGGYLAELVRHCQKQLTMLPSYNLVKTDVMHLAGLYSDLQTYKHLDPDIRETKMTEWIKRHIMPYPGITTWEFAAASGSTLGIFTLCAAASRPNLTEKEVRTLVSAYFPWICGLHILLDYFIDAAEDRENGDLNFTFYYQSAKMTEQRLRLFVQLALEQARTLPHQPFTETVVQGLLAMYLSDPKASAGDEKIIADRLLGTAGFYTRCIHGACRFLRASKIL